MDAPAVAATSCRTSPSGRSCAGARPTPGPRAPCPPRRPPVSMAGNGAWRMGWPVDCASTWTLQACSSCHILSHASATERPTVSRAVVSHDHRVLVAEVGHEPLSLVDVHGHPLELVVSDALVKLVAILLKRQQALSPAPTLPCRMACGCASRRSHRALLRVWRSG